MQLEDIQKDKSFKHTDNLEASIKDENTAEQKDPVDDLRRFGPDAKMVKMYEVWDQGGQPTFHDHGRL